MVCWFVPPRLNSNTVYRNFGILVTCSIQCRPIQLFRSSKVHLKQFYCSGRKFTIERVSIVLIIIQCIQKLVMLSHVYSVSRCTVVSWWYFSSDSELHNAVIRLVSNKFPVNKFPVNKFPVNKSPVNKFPVREISSQTTPYLRITSISIGINNYVKYSDSYL